MEHEVNGLDYRYVYGNERLSVNVSPIENGSGHIVETGTVGQQVRLYYHQDLRGTVDYLTSPVSQKVESWTHYNEWGEITHNAVLKCGQRELDLVKLYAGHDFDAVLNMYYAKARMYDAENRRFVSMDPILDGTRYDLKEYTTDAVNFTAYIYVQDNPLRWVDLLGLITSAPSPTTIIFRNPPDPQPGFPPDLLPGENVDFDEAEFAYKSTDALVLYDSRAFRRWTSLQPEAHKVADGLMEANNAIERVLLYDTGHWSTEEIEKWWNSLPEDGIEAIVIYGHASWKGVQLNSGDANNPNDNATGITLDRLTGTHKTGQKLNLEKKKVNCFILFSCNNAHQDYPAKVNNTNLPNDNFAHYFAENYLMPGSSIIGTDGSMHTLFVLGKHAWISKSDYFIRYSQESYGDNERPSSVRNPLGFIKYTVEDDGSISKTVLGHYIPDTYGPLGMGFLEDITKWLVRGRRY